MTAIAPQPAAGPAGTPVRSRTRNLRAAGPRSTPL